jgi:hypothetical protein
MTWRSLGDSNPCFRPERATQASLFVLAAHSLPACPRPRVCNPELLCIAGVPHHIGWVRARIEERDRNLEVALSDLAELHPDGPLARIRAYGFRKHANGALELRRYLIEHRLHDRCHARPHDYIADPEARRP